MLPFILIPLAVGAGAGGMKLAFDGVNDLAGAKEKNQQAINLNDENIKRFTEAYEKSQKAMEKLGETELKITSYFKYFIDAFERIENRPEFQVDDKLSGLPKFDFNEIKTVTVAVNAFLGAAGGAAAGGVAGAAASAGAMNAILALGVAGNGVPIAGLHGAAAVNAALAALGGGPIAAGGGGMVLGTFVLNALGLGAGMLIGGAAFAVMGNKVNKKAEELMQQVLRSETEINRNIDIFEDIIHTSIKLRKALTTIHNKVFVPNVVRLEKLVTVNTDWNTYSDEEKLLVENNIIIVSILHKLANRALYKVTETDSDGNVVSIEPDTVSVSEDICHSISQVKSIKETSIIE